MQRWSQLFIPTLREAPADAEVASHKFLVRAGYIRQLAAGIYSYCFMAQRSLLKITAIVRRNMDTIGQEFYFPALNPREIWEAAGRWQVMGDNMFRLKDRYGRDLALGMTHEEVATDIARKELRSYKQLPQIWYQIQTKFRDEPRPKSGLLRVRQFIMKDAYSFDIDAAGLDVSYKKHYDVYSKTFTDCGLKFVVVEAHSGAMGGSQSHEFMVYTEAGEDMVASCAACGYAANLEKAQSRLTPIVDPAEGTPEEIATPGKRTIEEVAAFLGVLPTQKIKTLAFMSLHKKSDGTNEARPVIALMRGDHQLNEAKFMTASGADDLRPMTAEEIFALFRSPAGYLGPVGLDRILGESEAHTATGAPLLLLDAALAERRNLIAGANKEDFHLRNLTPGKDFKYTRVVDLRSVSEGEGCPNCGAPLKVAKAVEIGHIFKLGYKYAEAMGARVLDRDGKEVTMIMGSYGIGIERILTSAIEQYNDADGFWLPRSIAPFDVVVVPTNIGDAAIFEAATKIAADLEAAGFDVLLDDRDERAGVKFKDADLVGIPFRINVGKKVAQGSVELVTRSTRESRDATIAAIVGEFRKAADAQA